MNYNKTTAESKNRFHLYMNDFDEMENSLASPFSSSQIEGISSHYGILKPMNSPIKK